MALFTITSGASSDLAVVKVSPIIDDCFTLYEYIVTANEGDDIDITLTGNHYKARYVLNGTQYSFTDSVSGITFNSTLRIRFLLLNTGVTGVYSSATIRIDNNSTGYYYENNVERQNDGANCYENLTAPTKTSDLLNDGDDGINAFIDSTDLANLVTTNTTQDVTGGKIFSGTNTFRNYNTIKKAELSSYVSSILWDDDGGLPRWPLAMLNNSESELFMHDGKLHLKTNTNVGATFNIDNTAVRTYTFPDSSGTVAFISDIPTTASNITTSSYLTLTSTDVQSMIEELKDEVDLIGGVTTIDATITNGSTNPVQNDAIYDEFQLVSYLAGVNSFTGATNTFTQTVVLHDTTDGLEIFNNGTENRIDTNSSALHIYSNSNSAGGWTFKTDSGLVGSSASYIYSPYITVDGDAYSSGWQSSSKVPTKGAIYNKIESLSLSGTTISGTPVDNQLAVWTSSSAIEGTSGLTYDGSNFQLTGDIGSTGSRITKGWFTNLEVTNDIVGDITGQAATVTSIGNLTGDVTSVNRVTTISAGAVDIAMLSASGTPSSSTFLRGDNTWATPAGSGDVVKVGTPVNNQLGVWTGDGTIEGDSNLTWNGVTLDITGDLVVRNNSVEIIGTSPRVDFNDTNNTGNWNIISDGGNLSFRENGASDTRLTIQAGGAIWAGGIGGIPVWTSANDGGGSGLDADLLDGVQGSSYLRSDAADIKTTGDLVFNDNIKIGLGTSSAEGTLYSDGSGVVLELGANKNFTIVDSGVFSGWESGNNIWYTNGSMSASNGITTGALTNWNDNDTTFDDDTLAIFYAGTMTNSPFAEGSVLMHSRTGINVDDSWAISKETGDNLNFYLSDHSSGSWRHSKIPVQESGVFTPALDPSVSGSYTYTVQTGIYRKIGDVVHIAIRLGGINDSSPVGTLRITGLPYAGNSNITQVVGPIAASWDSPNFYSAHAEVPSSQTFLNVKVQMGPDGDNTTGASNVTFSNGSIWLSGSYITN